MKTVKFYTTQKASIRVVYRKHGESRKTLAPTEAIETGLVMCYSNS